MIDRKSLYKLVRASSLQVGDSIAYRLKDDEISEFVLARAQEKGVRGYKARAFIRRPYKICEIRQILTFGSFSVLHLRHLAGLDPVKHRYYTILVKPDSYQGLYAGSTEGTLP